LYFMLRVTAHLHALMPVQAADTPVTPADGQAAAEDDADARQQAEQQREAEQLRQLDARREQAEGPWHVSLADLDQLGRGMDLSGGDWALLRGSLL
jgi:cytolysin (calcineurin-like family phosphatase)